MTPDLQNDLGEGSLPKDEKASRPIIQDGPDIPGWREHRCTSPTKGSDLTGSNLTPTRRSSEGYDPLHDNQAEKISFSDSLETGPLDPDLPHWSAHDKRSRSRGNAEKGPTVQDDLPLAFGGGKPDAGLLGDPDQAPV